jgi:thiol-disulfide isomerase/thioredoxin
MRVCPDCRAEPYFLAQQASVPSKKIHYLETLREEFPPEKFNWSSIGLTELFNAYDQSNPQNALLLANEVSKAIPNDDDWKTCSTYEQSMNKAEQLLAKKKAAAAVEVLATVSLPWFADRIRLDMLRAEAADANGETARAYGDLLKNLAQKPTDELRIAVAKYGRKLGKSTKQVDADVLKSREADAKPAPPFSLSGYSNGDPISLTDFGGHVILLSLWFPECGPCHAEFSNLRSIQDRFQGQGFRIVAANVMAAQDDLVLPLLKGLKLGFIPLKASDQIAAAYGVRGYPTNFLIGPDGRIWFRTGPVDDAGKMRTLELQIEALLSLKKNEDASSSP